MKIMAGVSNVTVPVIGQGWPNNIAPSMWTISNLPSSGRFFTT